MRHRFYRDTAFQRAVSFSPSLMMAMLIIPILGGIAGIILPAFGWLPALNEHTLNTQAWHRLLTQNGLAEMIRLNISTGFISTLIAVALNIAILSVFYNTRWMSRLQRIISPILVVPHAATAIAIAFLIAPSGMFSRALSPWLTGWVTPPDWLLPNDKFGASMILAFVIKELPFLLMMSIAALSQPSLEKHNKQCLRLATTLGYSSVTAFFKVILPQLYPFIRLPIYAVLAYSTSSVEIPLILGPSSPPPFSVAIVNWFSHPDLHLRFQASAGALLQIAVTLLVVVGWWLLEQVIKHLSRQSLYNGRRHYADKLYSIVVGCFTVSYLVIISVSLMAMILWSLAAFWPFPNTFPNGISLRSWSGVFSSSLDIPLVNSTIIASVAVAVSIVLTLAALESESLNKKRLSSIALMAIYLPMIMPSAGFLFGLVWLQEQASLSPGLVPVIFSHILFVLPYVFLSLASSYQLLDNRWCYISTSLGKSPMTSFFKVKCPLLFAPILIAIALGMAVSFSQYLPTLLAGAGRIDTITTEAVALANGSNRRVSAVYGLVQMLLPALGFLIAWLLPKLFFTIRDSSVKPPST